MNLVKKKLKLGLWVSLFSLTLPFYSIAQTNGTTISVKKEKDVSPNALSLSWSIYSNETISRDLINNELKIVCENRKIEITRFHLYIYKSSGAVVMFKIIGNQLTDEAVELLRRIRTNEAYAITVITAKNEIGKEQLSKFPTFLFFVN